MRSFVDQQYCCAEHRREARLASAQALREEEEVELWAVSRTKKKGPRAAASAGQTASIFAFLIVGGLLIAAMMLPGPGPGAAFPPVSLDPGVKQGLFERAGSAFGEMIRSRAPITLHQDFRSGWNGWTSTVLEHASRIDDPRKSTIRAPSPPLPFCASGKDRHRLRTIRWNSAARSNTRA